ncbi:MAG: hypothetical protein ACXWUX_14650 [Allosphingosinicella sp.]
MKLHGTLQQNLSAAVRSAQRLHGHPVHVDTLEYWGELLRHARLQMEAGSTSNRQDLEQILVVLETEIADRAS